MKTKLFIRPGIIAIGFDEKSFFSTILGFTPVWDYEHYIDYVSQKNVNRSTTNKINMKCNCINGSLLDGCWQPMLYSFVLNRVAIKCFAIQKQFSLKK